MTERTTLELFVCSNVFVYQLVLRDSRRGDRTIDDELALERSSEDDLDEIDQVLLRMKRAYPLCMILSSVSFRMRRWIGSMRRRAVVLLAVVLLAVVLLAVVLLAVVLLLRV